MHSSPYPLLYLVHYVVIPGAIIFISWKLYDDKENLNSFSSHKDKLKKEYKKLMIKYHKTIAIFVAILLMSFSTWGFTATVMMDYQIKRGKIIDGVNPVEHQLGPSYELDPILEGLEGDPSIWIPEELQEKVDFEELTSIPGLLTVYRLHPGLFGPRIIVTYTYASPLPITRAFGFQFERSEEDGGEVMFHVEREESYLFPMDPGKVIEIADFCFSENNAREDIIEAEPRFILKGF